MSRHDASSYQQQPEFRLIDGAAPIRVKHLLGDQAMHRKGYCDGGEWRKTKSTNLKRIARVEQSTGLESNGIAGGWIHRIKCHLG